MGALPCGGEFLAGKIAQARRIIDLPDGFSAHWPGA
jgi:hypothetical protein